MCAPELCPAGTTCEPETGTCVAIDGEAPPVGELGGVVSAALSSSGDVLVAAYDFGFSALVLQTHYGDRVEQVRVDGGAAMSDVGWGAAMGIGSGDEVRIAYYDRTRRDLRVASRDAGVWTLATADGEGEDVGRWPSLVVDDLAFAHVAYRDDTSSRLRVLSLAPHGCLPGEGQAGKPLVITSADMAAAGVESADFGRHTSVGISGDHKLLFSFYDVQNGNLMLGRCSGSKVDLQVLDGQDASGADSGDVGLWSSLAVDFRGDVGVAYFDRTRGALRYAGSVEGDVDISIVDAGGPCEGSDSSIASAWVGQRASLDLFHSSASGPGLPRIAYLDATARSVRLARRSAHGTWSCRVVPLPEGLPGAGQVALGLDIAVSEDDGAAIAFGAWSGEGGVLSSALEVVRLDATGEVR